MKIPDVRERLAAIAQELEDPNGTVPCEELARQIREMITQLYRRAYVRKAPEKSRHMTPGLKDTLRADAARHPDLSYQEIAVVHGVNAGRVSEAVAGKRK